MQVSEEELDMLEMLFKNADTNSDGVVDFAEFRALMDELAEKTGKRCAAHPGERPRSASDRRHDRPPMASDDQA